MDVRLPSRAGVDSLEVAVRAIRQRWPKAVFENAETGDRCDYLRLIPFGDVRELFVYRDARSAGIWDEEGAIPEVSNTMIHVLYDEDLITAVIDGWDAEMTAIINAMRSNLADTIHHIRAAVREAA